MFHIGFILGFLVGIIIGGAGMYVYTAINGGLPGKR